MQYTSRGGKHVRLESLVGCAAISAYAELVRATDQIRKVSVVRYTQPPRLERRTGLDDYDQGLAKEAREIKIASGLPYWSCLSQLVLRDSRASKALLDGMSFHQVLDGGRTVLERRDVLDGALSVEAGRMLPTENLAMSSRVILTGALVAHIPMLDFLCASEAENIGMVAEIAGRLMTSGGFLVNSGNSYHAIGAGLLPPVELPRFLGHAALYGDIVDQRYIAHQLIQGECFLRISRSAERGVEPKVVGIF